GHHDVGLDAGAGKRPPEGARVEFDGVVATAGQYSGIHQDTRRKSGGEASGSASAGAMPCMPRPLESMVGAPPGGGAAPATALPSACSPPPTGRSRSTASASLPTASTPSPLPAGSLASALVSLPTTGLPPS